MAGGSSSVLRRALKASICQHVQSSSMHSETLYWLTREVRIANCFSELTLMSSIPRLECPVNFNDIERCYPAEFHAALALVAGFLFCCLFQITVDQLLLLRGELGLFFQFHEAHKRDRQITDALELKDRFLALPQWLSCSRNDQKKFVDGISLR